MPLLVVRYGLYFNFYWPISDNAHCLLLWWCDIASLYHSSTDLCGGERLLPSILVGGFWGPIPIHLSELAHPALRTTVVSLTYQLRNLASGDSAPIQGVMGQRFPLPPKRVNGVCTDRFDCWQDDYNIHKAQSGLR